MAYIPPPRSLTHQEYNERIKNGAKTLEEIDPDLAKWIEQCRHHTKWSIILICGIIITVIITLITINIMH